MKVKTKVAINTVCCEKRRTILPKYMLTVAATK